MLIRNDSMEASRVGVTRSAWGIAAGNRRLFQDIVCAIGNNGINDNHSITIGAVYSPKKKILGKKSFIII